jgi:alkylation response protein AidB-like acyl-CoA dehydrogenase
MAAATGNPISTATRRGETPARWERAGLGLVRFVHHEPLRWAASEGEDSITLTISTTLPDLTVSEVLGSARDIAGFCSANAAAIDCDNSYPARELARIGAAGLLSAPLSRFLGGIGLGFEPGGMADLLRLLTILGSGNLSVARLYEGHVNALLLIQQFGSPQQIERAAADVAEDRRVFAIWNTEGAGGVRINPLDDGRFALEGAKIFASGAGFIDRPLITAALPGGGWQMVLLDLQSGDAAVDQSGWRPIGMKASASGRIDLTGLTVTGKALIGESGDYYRQPWFSAGAIRFASAQLGGAIALVDVARADLQASGRTEDDAQRCRMGQMAIAIESGLLWLERAAALADRSRFGGARIPTITDREMVAYANMTRIAIERICLDAIEYGQRSVGARSLLKPHPVERISRDLALYLRQPAPDAVLRDAGEFGLSRTNSLLDAWERA